MAYCYLHHRTFKYRTWRLVNLDELESLLFPISQVLIPVETIPAKHPISTHHLLMRQPVWLCTVSERYWCVRVCVYVCVCVHARACGVYIHMHTSRHDTILYSLRNSAQPDRRAFYKIQKTLLCFFTTQSFTARPIFRQIFAWRSALPWQKTHKASFESCTSRHVHVC